MCQLITVLQALAFLILVSDTAALAPAPAPVAPVLGQPNVSDLANSKTDYIASAGQGPPRVRHTSCV